MKAKARKDFEQSRQSYFRGKAIERKTQKVAAFLMAIGCIAFIVSLIGLGVTSGATAWAVSIFVSIVVLFIGFALIPIVGLLLMAFNND